VALIPVEPVNSVSSVILGGSVIGPTTALSAGQPSATPITAAPGVTDTSATIAPLNTADGFNDAINFGTLSNGNGSNEVGTVTFRERSNNPCHVSVSVSAYTANNISYNGTPLTGSTTSAAQLNFITLGSLPATAGPQGDMSRFNYGVNFSSGIGTLASLNAGAMGAVSKNDATFVSFRNAPSQSGGLTSPTNWVEDTATFSCPTGFVWSPTGSAPNNFSVTLQFAMFTGP
jgi:hypothetical protein